LPGRGPPGSGPRGVPAGADGWGQRPRLGFRPWLAFLVLAFLRALAVRLDIAAPYPLPGRGPAGRDRVSGEPLGGPGRVVLVATPIGNLGDLSRRGVETLEAAQVICCEDTRRTRALLSALGLPTPQLLVLHRHNEAAAAASAVALAASGSLVAVVSDAGTPGISDPGVRVVAAAVAAGVEVSMVPGPSAAVVAAVLSGLDVGRWCFEGFLPRKGGERTERLEAIAADPRPTVIYESPQRVGRTLADLSAACGADRPVAVARELTKLYEQCWRGQLGAAAERFGATPERGEWVLVVGGAPPAPVDDAAIVDALVAALAGGADRRGAVAEVAGALRVGRRRVYQLLLHAVPEAAGPTRRADGGGAAAAPPAGRGSGAEDR